MYSKIMATIADARKDHDVWKDKMSEYAEEVGRLEMKARVIILQEDFCAALLDIANGLVLV